MRYSFAKRILLTYEPTSKWEVAALLPLKSSSEGINSKVQEILQDKQYFQTCQECHKRKPRGWMHNDGICQSCAERNHGIVY